MGALILLCEVPCLTLLEGDASLADAACQVAVAFLCDLGEVPRPGRECCRVLVRVPRYHP
jgi:hypothetical protein